MENNNENTGGTNWTPPAGGQGGAVELPDSKSAFTLGLIGLILSPFCCCGISGIGIVLSILGLMRANKALAAYDANPAGYTPESQKKAKTAKTLAMIGLIISILTFIWFIISLFLQGSNFMDYNRMMKQYR